MKSYKSIANQCVAAFVAAAVLAPVHAADTDSSSGLEEIIVTAQKREQDFQTLAISAEVITAQQIEQSGATQIQDAIRQVPGVKIQNIAGTGSGRIFIRGIGTTSGDEFQSVIANGVAMNVDGVNSNNASNLLSTMFDVQRIEVLKGPQGTLYGSSALGGAVNVVTGQPTDHWEAVGRVQAGNYNAHTEEGLVNIPLGDTFAVRITGVLNKRDGYVTGPKEYTFAFVPPPLQANFGPTTMPSDNHGAVDSKDVRIRALWKPAENLSVLMGLEHTNDTGTSPTWLNPTDVLNGILRCCNLGASAPPDFATKSWYVDTYFKRSSDTLNGQINYDLGKVGSLTFQSSYNLIKDSGQELTLEQQQTNAQTRQKQTTYELRLNSAAESRITYVAGLYAQRTDRVFNPSTTRFSPSPDTDGNPATVEYALFQQGRPYDTYNAYGQVTVPLAENTRATAGLRYSANKADYTYNLYLTANPCSSPPAASCSQYDTLTYFSPTFSSNTSHPYTTWNLELEHDLAPQSLIYARAATGFKSGGVEPVNSLVPITTPAPVALQPYKSEDSLAYEIGSKNRFFNNTLQVNGAIFYTTWNNMQLNTLVCGVPGCNLFGSQTYTEFFNASASHQYGLEFDTTWLITPNDRASFSSSFMHGTYGHTHYAWGAPGFSGYVDLGGHEMAQTPKASGTLTLAHIFHLANADKITATLENEYSSHYETTHEYYFAGHTQPGYFRNNASLTYDHKRWEVNAYARNLQKKTTIQSVFPFGVQGGDPRLFGASVQFKY